MLRSPAYWATPISYIAKSQGFLDLKFFLQVMMSFKLKIVQRETGTVWCSAVCSNATSTLVLQGFVSFAEGPGID
jgi:hypothetical protein